MAAYVRITDIGDIEGMEARYHGGAYIELGHEDGGMWIAGEVINVYDYAAGEPRIEATPQAVEARVIEWLQEQADLDAEDDFDGDPADHYGAI